MARFTEWCDELEEALAEPFPREIHKAKDRKGTFVPYQAYVHRLNELVGIGGWSMTQPGTYHAGNKLGMAVNVTILGVSRWNVGDEMEDHGEPVEYVDDKGETREKVVDFGSSSTNSWAQAFKRTCALFGLGLYLYDKDFTKAYLAGRLPPRQPAGPSPAVLRERIGALVAVFADPAVKLDEKQRRTVKVAAALADKQDAPHEHLTEGVARLEALRQELGLPETTQTEMAVA